MYRRFISIEERGLRTVPRKRSDGDGEQLPEIHGTAAVYYDQNNRAATQYELWPGHVERIREGAFHDAVKEDDVRALQNHDSRLLLGRSAADTLNLTLRNHGLDYEIDTPDTLAGRDTITSLQRGDLTGSSFQFNLREGGSNWEEEETDDGITIYVRNITKVRLFDVGPVTFPAYTGTSSGVGRSSLCLSDCRSAEARSELESLKSEVETFIREQNYTSEAAANWMSSITDFACLSTTCK